MIVYVASPESQEIHVFRLDEAGAMQPLQVVATQGQAQPLAISPDRRFLYAGVRPEHAVITYRIAADGQLTELARGAVAGSPTYVSTDRTGRSVFSASYAGSVLSVCPVDAAGVAGAARQNFADLPCAHAAVMDASNRWLLVPTLGDDRIRIFALQDGRLAEHGEVRAQAGAGPRHPVFHPSAPLVYCINELDGSINVHDFDAESGVLTLRASCNALPPGFAGKPWSADLHLSPDARFIYGCDRTDSMISIHRLDNGGASLALVGHVATETQPRGFAITPCGTYLIAAGQLSNQVAVYRIDAASGGLALLQRVPAGRGPMWVQVLAPE